ncbi:hypothetical protein CEXT_226251 [Caerostris extrusa]|uniref:Uncharacterized protein n=1 Tax=Caerostris extrusa TaxID=172846 RepID=A0AAV4P345_CAEEX|nr:hypothetical protein CEXT_226251 [Caerostris extrusa]
MKSQTITEDTGMTGHFPPKGGTQSLCRRFPEVQEQRMLGEERRPNQLVCLFSISIPSGEKLGSSWDQEGVRGYFMVFRALIVSVKVF